MKRLSYSREPDGSTRAYSFADELGEKRNVKANVIIDAIRGGHIIEISDVDLAKLDDWQQRLSWYDHCDHENHPRSQHSFSTLCNGDSCDAEYDIHDCGTTTQEFCTNCGAIVSEDSPRSRNRHVH